MFLAEPVDYGALVNMVRAFEKKYARKMYWNELVAYVAAVRQISGRQALLHARDMERLKKIYLDYNKEVTVLV